ncbi:MAG: hypothetical protein EAZ92_13020 [Candidatus Kapaibacterium sp.]|nr:MAG: hypothetical protein EAZ92_13020 [Candidatus Kapabacteria bacterium]
MAYQSVDTLQKALTENVFHYAKDGKKAAGRALGTMVEIITFYLLKAWQFEEYISIERSLVEYGNSDITHNVEYSLHPHLQSMRVSIENTGKTITAKRILRQLEREGLLPVGFREKSTTLLTADGIMRNGCVIAVGDSSLFLARIEQITGEYVHILVYEQHKKPFAMFECKRVGVEEGQTKGPQTIEKAKQGAYVARSASSLQKIRTETGELHGILYNSDNSFIIKPYHQLLEEVIATDKAELLRRFIVTVGIVSNHGNWFTAENQNKELKVLAQSYDWLLFLTDAGLAQFIEQLLLKPTKQYQVIQEAFSQSYTAEKKKNQFTKVQMSADADKALQAYFAANLHDIEQWFNVISPREKTLSILKSELQTLTQKRWQEVLA